MSILKNGLRKFYTGNNFSSKKYNTLQNYN